MFFERLKRHAKADRDLIGELFNSLTLAIIYCLFALSVWRSVAHQDEVAGCLPE